MLLIVLSGAINRIGKGRPRLSGLARHGAEALLHRGTILNSDGFRCGVHRAARVPPPVRTLTQVRWWLVNLAIMCVPNSRCRKAACVVQEGLRCTACIKVDRSITQIPLDQYVDEMSADSSSYMSDASCCSEFD